MIRFKYCLLVLISAAAFAIEMPIRPEGRVSDYTGKLSHSQIQSLNNSLKTIEDSTTNQVAIAVFPSIGGEDIDGFTNTLFRKWRIGQKGKNNGVLLVVAMAEHRMRIEVGYGLEGVLPDAKTAEINRGAIKPKLRNGDLYGALTGFVESIAVVLKPQTAEATSFVQPVGESTAIFWWFGLFIVLVMGGLLFTMYLRRKNEETEPIKPTTPSPEDHGTYTPSTEESPRVSDVVLGAAAGVATAVAVEELLRKRQEPERETHSPSREDDDYSSSSSSSYDSDSSSSDSGGSDWSGSGGDSGGGGSSDAW